MRERKEKIMSLKDAITKRFYDLIDKKGMSIRQVEEKSNISHSSINNIINRYKKYSTDVVNAMAYGLDMTIREFFNDPIFDDIDME